MTNAKETLKAFLEQEFAQQGMTLDQATLNALYRHIEFTLRPSNESEEVRTVKTKQDSSGKVTAESIKLWNISKISLDDLLKFLWKEMGVIVFEETAQKVLYGLGTLLFEYSDKRRHQFNEQDAQVLFAIGRLKQKAFTTQEVLAQFKKDFKTSIEVERLEDTFDELIEWQVIRRTSVQQYELKERITNLSRRA